MAPSATPALERCWALLDAGAPDEAAAVADQVETQLEQDPSATAEDDRVGLLRVRVRCHLMRGDLDAALVLHTWSTRHRTVPVPAEPGGVEGLVDLMAQLGLFGQAAALIEQHGRVVDGPMAEAAAAAALAEGRLRAALDLAATALGHPEVARRGALVSDRVAWVTGAALLEQGHVAAALGPLRAARALARRGGLQHVVVRAGTALARAHTLLGDPASALAVLEEIRRPLHRGRLPTRVRTWIDQAEARLLLVEGDVEDADVIVERLDDHGLIPDLTVLRAWTALARADPEQAGRLLDRVWPAEVPIGVRIEADILRCQCTVDRTDALLPLAAAVRRAGEEGHVAPFLEHRTGMLDALRALDAVEPSPHLTLLQDQLEGR